MNSWQIARFGVDALEMVERPNPRPGPGEVLVRWRAWSINYRDLVVVRGTYIPDLPLPYTPLSDAAGEIAAVGEGVSEWRPGDRVIGHYIQSWRDGRATPENTRLSLGGMILPGVLSEYSVLPRHGIVPLPGYLSFQEGATLPIAALTAWNALFEHGELPPGSTVLLEGTGGVSLFGLQFARAAGLRTIITSGSDGKLARATALGADHVINYRTHPDWSREVRRLTDGRGVDVALEVGGPATFNEALRSLRMGGRVAVIGFLSGTAMQVDALGLIERLATVHAVRVGSLAMFLRMLQAFDRHRIRPQIDSGHPFADAPKAFARIASGEHFGKIVITE